jgi:hypothetical protein
MINRNISLLLLAVFVFAPYQVYGASSLTKKQGALVEELGRRVSILNGSYMCGLIRESEMQRCRDIFIFILIYFTIR